MKSAIWFMVKKSQPTLVLNVFVLAVIYPHISLVRLSLHDVMFPYLF